MVSKAASERFPPWLLAASLIFLLFVAVGLLVIVFRDLPAPIKPEVVERQFAEHLAFMKELALACPALDPPSLPDPSSDAEKTGLKEKLEVWETWSRKSESRPDLFSHPALLGASVRILNPRGGTNVHFTLKNAEGLEPTWLESFLGSLGKESVKPEVGRPVVLYRRSGSKDLALYENRMPLPEGLVMGCHLLLDLEYLDTSSE